MADEEQFSLCWNNFNSNLSAGFHESLCRGDLVDVTLAAEGHLVKAHRLVLSVCSPYFRKMFTQMPANQHAFVFLKDVSHAALKDLIQFMYCGEVNVKQDALPTFISTAEALQIKGLTETGEAAATPASAQSPAKVPTPAPSTTSTIAATSPRTRGIQRNISRTSYKIDSEDSSDDKPIVPVPQKRIVQRSLTPVTALPPMKRIKTVDPLEEAEQQQAQQQQQQQQQHQHHHHTQLISAVESKSSDEPEFIDLPIETIPTKAEPDYGEDGGDVEAVEQDVSYVEDDSYGDMKYDESYFTENDEAKPGASGFTETAYPDGGGEQSTNEAQGRKRGRPRGSKNNQTASTKVPLTLNVEKYLSGQSWPLVYVQNKFGGMKISFCENHFYFSCNKLSLQFWRCINYKTNHCPAILISKNNSVYVMNDNHNHEDNADSTDELMMERDESIQQKISPKPNENIGKLSILNLKEQMKLKLQKGLKKKN